MSAYPRADSPTAPFSSGFDPVSARTSTATTTNVNQAAIASTGRRVLQRPMAVGEKRLNMNGA